MVKDHYRQTNRGAQGVTSIKLRDGDSVVAAIQVEPNTEKNLLILTQFGQAVRIPVEQIRRTARNCYGVRVISFNRKKGDDKVANVSLVDNLSEEDAAVNEAKAAAAEESAERAASFEAQRSVAEAEVAAREEEEFRRRQEAEESGEAGDDQLQ